MLSPEQYPRRILITAAGLTPQVITETLYALAVARKPAFVPTEAHVFTTREGAERVRLQLLTREPGWFHRLREEYTLPPIRFSMEQVHVAEHDGAQLDDVHTPEENAAVADAATALVAELCNDPEAAVHVSLAGGRKTMGYYLGYALSLHGRPQDRLSHVLVAPPFESHPEFFYPTRSRRVIYAHTPDHRPMDTSEAQVQLAEIPFVRLRDGLPEDLLKGRMRFSDTVALTQEALGPATLLLDVEAGKMRCNGREVVMPQVYFAFYAAVVRLWLDGAPPARKAMAVAAFMTIYRDLAGEWDGNFVRVEESLDGQEYLPEARFDEYLSCANRWLRRALGPLAAPFMLSGRKGGKKVNHYGPWRLAPGDVHFAKLGESAHDERPRQSSGEDRYDKEV